MSIRERLTEVRRTLKQELRTYKLLLCDPRVPRLAKWSLGLAVAYALSPIDLIPDFIPVIGHVDDLVIVPSLVLIALWLIPSDVMSDCRARAQDRMGSA